MQFVVIAFLCIVIAFAMVRLNAPFRRSLLFLVLAALAVGLLDGLGFMYVEFHDNHGDYFDPHSGAFDIGLALKMFLVVAAPAALLAFGLSFIAWLVFRPIFGRKAG
jgi:hypothetical protein